MQTYKKFKKIAPIAILSAAILCFPISSFAIENTTQQSNFSQERIIQGYLFKNDVKTPIYTNGIKNRAQSSSP